MAPAGMRAMSKKEKSTSPIPSMGGGGRKKKKKKKRVTRGKRKKNRELLFINNFRKWDKKRSRTVCNSATTFSSIEENSLLLL